MTYRCNELSRTALLALTCSLSLGCDAPEKTVGQETDGGTESGSASDSDSDSDSDCGGVLPCGTNASESESESESESSTNGETGETTDSGTGVPGDCDANDNASDCGAEGCVWQDTVLIEGDGATCEIADGNGFCADPGPANPDPGGVCSPCPADGEQYWTRELEDGTWEVLSDGCFGAAPAGFTLCAFAGNDPTVCDCACSGTAASLPAGFETTLGASGCADMAVYGATPDGSIGLVLSTGFNPVADAVAAGETLVTTHDVSELARLSVYVGTNVTYPECNDALDKSAYSIDQEWVATAGTVEIEIEPVPDAIEFGTQGFATVTVTGLEVSFAGVTEAVGSVTFEDVAVGWLPG